MTGTTVQQTRSRWQDTRTIIAASKTPTSRHPQTDQSRPTTKAQAEQEADRWVVEMMFERYNG